jgi:hypothetical protein
MAIRKKRPNDKIEIDLSGPQGNAFYLLGVAKQLSKQLEFDYREIHAEMTSGDYENLIQVFDSYFGSVVDLYR